MSNYLVTNQIITKYLEIILNWPFLGFTLVLILLYFFKDPVYEILKKASLGSKMGFLEIESQLDTEALVAATPPAGDVNYEFMYLNTFIVHNSKLALTWLYTNGPATEEEFKANIQVHPETSTDPESEKNAIVHFLRSNHLTEVVNSSTHKITDKGKNYLRYNSFIA